MHYDSSVDPCTTSHGNGIKLSHTSIGFFFFQMVTILFQRKQFNYCGFFSVMLLAVKH